MAFKTIGLNGFDITLFFIYIKVMDLKKTITDIHFEFNNTLCKEKNPPFTAIYHY
jgi:hypothetical protein